MFSEIDIPAEAHTVLTLVLCVFMVSAVFTDMREHRIKNSLVVLVLLLGLVAQTALNIGDGWISWGAGLLIGIAMFMPFYAGGGMGAGDVKLMAAVAAFLGPVAGVIACASTLIAGLPLAVMYMLKRYANEHVFESHMDTGDSGTFKFNFEQEKKRQNKDNRIPYAAAIFAGTTVGLWWAGRFEPFLAGLI